ncbi:hypothetical protein CE154_021870 [Alicycliphilus denitrificans]|uniref:Uncharacterized protein n=1 Tax=Alicycliphilus denitrificans TaxID=179636 RepID=A0A3R7IDS7_9BURK|nr:hypothetical protein CE154_021870 [Alicycliphilus denitrificans]
MGMGGRHRQRTFRNRPAAQRELALGKKRFHHWQRNREFTQRADDDGQGRQGKEGCAIPLGIDRIDQARGMDGVP